MMYNQKIAAAIKVNGKVLREFKDKVYLPFGSEYSILIKNMNTTRALVNIFIDGAAVVDGGLVIDAGKEVELKRFVTSGNMNIGNAFKFIERTTNIENHRGIKLEDGLVRLEYQFEKVLPTYDYTKPIFRVNDSTWSNDLYHNSGNGYSNVIKTLRATGNGTNVGAALYSTTSATAAVANSVEANDVGITVAGSVVDQKFQHVYGFNAEPTKHSMVIHLVGETENSKQVVEPVTVKTKPKCTTCGKHNRATNKFCSECGTSLTIVA